jgi:hypothetical protein
VTEVLRAVAGLSPTLTLLSATLALSVVTIVSLLTSGRRQKVALGRVEERVAQLSTGVSLLTNTTEDGLRGVALEIARLASAADAKAQPHSTLRERIAAAAGHGRSVQDIAASEQLSEGEVLLHMLIDRLRPEVSSAEVC